MKTIVENKNSKAPSEFNAVPVTPSHREGYEEPHKPITSSVYCFEDFIEKEKNEPKAIIENILYQNTLNLVCGSPKVGKSTFIRWFIKSICDGTEFLGYKTRKSNVLYLPLDEPSWMVAKNLKKMKSKFSGLVISKFESSKDPIGDIESICLNHKIEVVVVDLISKLEKIPDTSNYSYVDSLLLKYRKLSDKLGVSFVFLHHASKSNQNSALGSQSFEGSVDNIIYLTSKTIGKTTKYYFSTKGRVEILSKKEIIYNKEEGSLFLANEGIAFKLTMLRKENPEISGSEIAKKLGIRKAEALKLVKSTQGITEKDFIEQDEVVDEND